MNATIAGHSVRLVATKATVEDALELAGVRPHVGLMRSAATGTPLDIATRPPSFIRDGRRVGLSALLRDGDRVAVRDGKDWIEPVVTQRVVVHAPSLPPVETQLWLQPHDGLVERVTGEHSGEVLKETVLDPPSPAALSAGRELVLSFDDGPDARWSPMVLDILRDRGVKAMFCLVGIQMRRYPALVKRIYDEGHVLCNHTDNHDVRLREKPEAVIRERIDAVTTLMQQITGQRPRFYRAPGGVLSDYIVSYVRSQGMRVVGWAVDSVDYRKPGAEAIFNRVVGSVRPGGLVLLHDAGGDRSQTVAQLPALIDRLRADGYVLTVP